MIVREIRALTAVRPPRQVPQTSAWTPRESSIVDGDIVHPCKHAEHPQLHGG